MYSSRKTNWESVTAEPAKICRQIICSTHSAVVEPAELAVAVVNNVVPGRLAPASPDTAVLRPFVLIGLAEALVAQAVDAVDLDCSGTAGFALDAHASEGSYSYYAYTATAR